MSDLVYIDAAGDKQALDFGVHTYREAAEANLSVPQYLATRFPTNVERNGSAFEQALEQCGVFVKGNKAAGIPSSTLESVLGRSAASGAITIDGVPGSRVMFPAAILSAVEAQLDKGFASPDGVPNAFDQMVAFEDSIQGTRFERPVIDYSKTGKEMSMPVAQLAMPPTMIGITVSDVTRTIPSWAIGVEISEQAQKAWSMDLLSLVVARQARNERNTRAQGYLDALVNGDSDLGQIALDASSGRFSKASAFDSSITTAGTLTQKAWVAFLSQHSTERVITTLVTDLAGATAIDNRTGRPTPAGAGPILDLINPTFRILNAQWPGNVDVYITNSPSWPANTILGFDKRYGIHRVRSLTAAYRATEDFVLKRSTAMRIDNGELVYRLFDEAFDVLSLTV